MTGLWEYMSEKVGNHCRPAKGQHGMCGQTVTLSGEN